MAFANCGGTGTVSGTPTFFATAFLIGSTIAALAGVVQQVAEKIAGLIGPLSTFLSWLAPILGVSTWGAAALVAIVLTAMATVVAIIVWAVNSHSALCGVPSVGRFACVTGVVNAATSGFASAHSELVGFQNNQPRLDVVVKEIYWPIVAFNNPPVVHCAACTNCPTSVFPPAAANPGAPCSPVLHCYYHDAQVCNASLGSAWGAAVGAGVGGVLSVIAAIAVFGALGCSFTAVFSWICLLGLLLVLVIVVAAVALVAAIGSLIGTQAGKASAGGTAAPTAGQGVAIAAGAYVSVLGNLVQATPSLGANVIWFAGWIPNLTTQTVDDNTLANSNGTTVLGASTGVAPFCHTDADTNIPPTLDMCRLP